MVPGRACRSRGAAWVLPDGLRFFFWNRLRLGGFLATIELLHPASLRTLTDLHQEAYCIIWVNTSLHFSLVFWSGAKDINPLGYVRLACLNVRISTVSGALLTDPDGKCSLDLPG